jgi:hypothetical protein
MLVVLFFSFCYSQFTQQGAKLVGTGSTGLSVYQGYSVALSGDGATLAVGGKEDNSQQGAAWVFTLSGVQWSQQGAKLVGSGNVGAARQGTSVALSNDGNTMAVGGTDDDGNEGAVWIFTRTGSTWSQQGSKLVGTGGSGNSRRGRSVALSNDGNTLAVGAYSDGSDGAVWIFTRTGSTWSQQGVKLVGTGATGGARQGWSIALSSDGNVLASGGYQDNSFIGAVWVFTRSGSIWSQQGPKLVGTGGVGTQLAQGYGISLSADGDTLASGGYIDNAGEGAVWIFSRSGSTWTQQGTKLVGTGGNAGPQQGRSVSLTSDGNALAIGGPHDGSQIGAVWIFSRSGTTWSQVGSKLIGTGYVGNVLLGTSVSISSSGTSLAVGGYRDNGNIGATWMFSDPNAATSASITTTTSTTPPSLGSKVEVPLIFAVITGLTMLFLIFE